MWAPCVAPVCFDYGCVQMNTGARATALRGDAERDIWALSSQQITVSSALRLHLIGPVSATSSFGSEPAVVLVSLGDNQCTEPLALCEATLGGIEKRIAK